MRNIVVQPNSVWRRFFPLVRKIRGWCGKCHSRIGIRFVISGGEVSFMDAVLNFPPGVAMTYSTPLFWNGPEDYEQPTSRTLVALLRRSQVFLDIGSNMGIYAVYAGIKFPHLCTYAFEPVPSIWQKNVAFHRANGLSDQNVLNIAVGDRVGVQSLILPIYTTGIEEEQTATLQGDSWQANEAHVERLDVECVTIDQFAATHDLPPGLCCLKIDVENHEAAVLRGGRNFIAARRPWIVCEVLPSQKIDAVTGVRTNDNGEVLSLVQELGYATFAITSEGLFRMNPKDFNPARGLKDFLFVPGEAVPADLCYLTPDLLEEMAGNKRDGVAG